MYRGLLCQASVGVNCKLKRANRRFQGFYNVHSKRPTETSYNLLSALTQNSNTSWRKSLACVSKQPQLFRLNRLGDEQLSTAEEINGQYIS